MKHILVFIGTRPEAIKLAPVIAALCSRPTNFNVTVCATSQHTDMLQQALLWFDLTPNEDLQIMRPNQTPAEVAASVLTKASNFIKKTCPDIVIVQGDTMTAMAAAMAGFYADIRVAHVEAGLRSGKRTAPWPEEINRTIISRLATWHFAPTDKNAYLLHDEKVSGEVHVVGNTVIDALLFIQSRLNNDNAMRKIVIQEIKDAGYPLNADREFILTTGHRRESFNGGLANICEALATLAKQRPQTDIVYAVHLNSHVRQTTEKFLRNIPNVYLLPPLDYAAFVLLMSRCRLLLTDSGGIQEEAPSLNKPVLVMRDVTERPEVVECGAAKLVGTNTAGIVNDTLQLLSDSTLENAMRAAKNPFGNGRSAHAIAEILST